MRVVLLVCFLVIQLGIAYSIFLRPAELAARNRWKRLLSFFTAQVLCAFLLLAGAYIEDHLQLYSKLRDRVDESRALLPETVHLAGDPGLVEWVKQEQPLMKRPATLDAEILSRWQVSLRRQLRQLFGFSEELPGAGVAVTKMRAGPVVPGIERTFLTFRSFDGTAVPAYLFLPTASNARPAILVVPGHVGKYEQGISQTGGISDSYQHRVALELAKAGFATLTFELRGFGYLGRAANTEHKLVAYNAILGGSFYKSILTKDIAYAFEVLRSLPGIDSNRLGITGVSFGGEMAVTYAALDTRVKATVFEGYGGELGPIAPVSGRDTLQPHYCHIVPGINKLLVQEDWYYLIAPRPLLGVRGDQDYSGDSRLFTRIVGKGFATLGHRSLFHFQIVHGGHEFFIKPAREFFQKYLLPGRTQS